MNQTQKRKLDEEAIVAGGLSKKPKSEQKGPQLKDLKDECLIKIFKHLAIKDLVNIVGYNERFLTPARDVFGTKFSSDIVNITREVKSTSEAVNLLKYFGSEIKKLKINYLNSCYERFEFARIDDAIIKYCQATLVEIKFRFPNRNMMNGLKTPFEKVQKACFSVAECTQLITDFGKWFPNAETLEIKDMQESNSPTVKNAPKLKNLFVCFKSKMSIVHEVVAPAIILSNPQLTTVSNTVIINRDGYIMDCLVKDAADDWIAPKAVWLHLQLDRCLPQLKSLNLVIPREKGVGFKRGRGPFGEMPDKFQFDELTELLIDFEDSTVLKGMPIFTKKLEKLSLLGSNLDSNCLQLIRNNNTPSYIKMLGDLKSNNLTGNLVKLLSTLPNLKELHFPAPFMFEPRYVIALLKKCKHLHKLAVLFTYSGSDYREKIESAFNAASGFKKSAWKTTYAENDAEYDFNRYEKRFSYSVTFEKSE